MDKILNKKTISFGIAIVLILSCLSILLKMGGKPAAKNISTNYAVDSSIELDESSSDLNINADDVCIEVDKPNGEKLKLKAGKLNLAQAKKLSDLISHEQSWDEMDFHQDAAKSEKLGVGFQVYPSWNLLTGKANIGFSPQVSFLGSLKVGPFINVSKLDTKAAVENLGIDLGVHSEYLGVGLDLIPNYNFESKATNVGVGVDFYSFGPCSAGAYVNASLQPSVENVGLKIGCGF